MATSSATPFQDPGARETRGSTAGSGADDGPARPGAPAAACPPPPATAAAPARDWATRLACRLFTFGKRSARTPSSAASRSFICEGFGT